MGTCARCGTKLYDQSECTDRNWCDSRIAARREGVIEGLQQACGLLLATVPEDALVHIRAEIERLREEKP